MTKPTALPNTPAGQVMSHFFDLYNQGDAPGVRVFVAAHYTDPAASKGPTEDRAVWNSLDYTTSLVKAIEYDSGCGLRLHSVEVSKPDQVAVIAQSGLAGEWLYLKMVVSPEPPHRLIEFRTRPAQMPPGLVEKRLSLDTLPEELDHSVGRLTEADIFSGVIAISRGGNSIYQRAFGLSSRDYDVSNHLATRFNIGSCNKMFTAVAIAQLVEQGRLRFEDTLAQHFPEYPHHPEKITIHHLLAHLSGVGSYWNERFKLNRIHIRSVQDFLALFVDQPLLAEPGERWFYSNAGYVILGAIIERITGRSYDDFMRESVYRPTGMLHTDAYEVDRPIPDLAIGYTNIDHDGNRDLSGIRSNLFMHVVKGGPGGGGFSVIGDLLKFDAALRTHQLLSPKMTANVLSGKVNVRGPEMQYAYGFWDRRMNTQRIVGHSGTFPGIGAQFDMLQDSDTTIAVLSNTDPVASQIVLDHLRDVLMWV